MTNVTALFSADDQFKQLVLKLNKQKQAFAQKLEGLAFGPLLQSMIEREFEQLPEMNRACVQYEYRTAPLPETPDILFTGRSYINQLCGQVDQEGRVVYTFAFTQRPGPVTIWPLPIIGHTQAFKQWLHNKEIKCNLQLWGLGFLEGALQANQLGTTLVNFKGTETHFETYWEISEWQIKVTVYADALLADQTNIGTLLE